MNLVLPNTNTINYKTKFHKDMIEMFVSSNISINQKNNKDFLNTSDRDLEIS